MDFEHLERTVKKKRHKSVKKSLHKHLYEDCIINQWRTLGNKTYNLLYTGGKCSICGKLYYKKILWDKNLEPYKHLPIYEDDQTLPILKKGV